MLLVVMATVSPPVAFTARNRGKAEKVVLLRRDTTRQSTTPGTSPGTRSDRWRTELSALRDRLLMAVRRGEPEAAEVLAFRLWQGVAGGWQRTPA